MVPPPANSPEQSGSRRPSDDPPETDGDETDATEASVVAWDLSTGTDAVSSAVMLAGVGLVVGFPVGILVFGGVAVALVSVLDGDPALLLGVAAGVVLALVVGRAEFTAIRVANDGSDGDGLGRRRLLVSAVCGGFVHAFAVAVGGSVEYSYVVIGLGLATIGAAGVVAGRGAVDTATGTVEYGGDELPLAAVRSYRAVGIGDRVVALLRYRGGVPRASRAVTLSREAWAAAEPVVRAAASGEANGAGDGDRPTRLPRAVRATAGGIAVAMAGVGVAVHVLAPPDLGPLIPVLLLGEAPVVAVLGWFAYAG